MCNMALEKRGVPKLECEAEHRSSEWVPHLFAQWKKEVNQNLEKWFHTSLTAQQEPWLFYIKLH